MRYVVICLIILLACSNIASADIISHKIDRELIDTGEATITFTIENNNGEGPVYLGIDFSKSGQAQHFTVEPTSQAIYMKAGETQTVSFTMIASDVKGDYNGKATLVATGGTGHQDTYTFSYTIKDTELLNANAAETTTTDSTSPQTFLFVLIVFALVLIVGLKMTKK